MLEFRSLFDDTAAAEIARDALLEDMRAARLTWKFRAYYRLRPFIPRRFRRMLQRFRKVAVETDWYIPRVFFERLAAASSATPRNFNWPGHAKFAFVLTHDVDTSDGLRQVPRIADMEEKLGFRSSWNIVPYLYKIDKGLIRELQDRGFEIGIHGYNHDGRLFASREIFRRRVAGINRALEDYRAVGFRAPMVHRNLEWMQDLNIEYDLSCFDIDPFQPMPGGVGSIWPFEVGRFVELPYTMPQDHTLFIAQGQRDTEVWRRKLEFLARHFGMALMTTHPDYLDVDRRLNLYRDFLLHVLSRGQYWHAKPMEVAAWWRRRYAAAGAEPAASARQFASSGSVTAISTM